MPKIKTHRGAAKRFGVTKSGKVKRAKAYRSHILNKKSTKRKRLCGQRFLHSCLYVDGFLIGSNSNLSVRKH